MRRTCAVLLGISLLVSFGCASSNYQFAIPPNQIHDAGLRACNPIRVGGDQPRLDRIESIVQTPASWLSRWFPPKTPPLEPAVARQVAVEKAQEYLLCNALPDVNIDVREYDPALQWERLQNNKAIHPVWRYTGGLVYHTQYTLLPDRVLHMDTYNPYTNTLSIGSTEPSSALYQSAVAKVVHRRRNPGAFSTACFLPIVPLVRDKWVADDVLSYARTRGDWQTEKRLVPEIYGRFGADLVAQSTSVIPGTSAIPFYYHPLMTIGGGLVGTATGRFVLRRREAQMHYSAEGYPWEYGVEGVNPDLRAASTASGWDDKR